MEMETIFRILSPLLILAFVLHRGYYVRMHGEEKNTLKKREEGWISWLAGSLGLVGFTALIAYVIQPGWLAWAALPLPLWLRWAGVGMALSGFMLLQWAQDSLGQNWSHTPRLIKEQSLVTSGPYQYIRHPIYTAFLLILGSPLFLSANLLIGLAWIGMISLEVASRIRFEENLMLEYFGEQYREYMKRTGRVLPRMNVVPTSVSKPWSD
jgi:protein-S-isoprenylcysteine O-methyltransferase Ste14